MIVIVAKGNKNDIAFSRRELVLHVANTDGGSHVDNTEVLSTLQSKHPESFEKPYSCKRSDVPPADNPGTGIQFVVLYLKQSIERLTRGCPYHGTKTFTLNQSFQRGTR